METVLSDAKTQIASEGYTPNLSRETLRRHGVRPYNVVDSGQSIQQVYDNLNPLFKSEFGDQKGISLPLVYGVLEDSNKDGKLAFDIN